MTVPEVAVPWVLKELPQWNGGVHCIAACLLCEDAGVRVHAAALLVWLERFRKEFRAAGTAVRCLDFSLLAALQRETAAASHCLDGMGAGSSAPSR